MSCDHKGARSLAGWQYVPEGQYPTEPAYWLRLWNCAQCRTTIGEDAPDPTALVAELTSAIELVLASPPEGYWADGKGTPTGRRIGDKLVQTLEALVAKAKGEPR